MLESDDDSLDARQPLPRTTSPRGAASQARPVASGHTKEETSDTFIVDEIDQDDWPAAEETPGPPTRVKKRAIDSMATVQVPAARQVRARRRDKIHIDDADL